MPDNEFLAKLLHSGAQNTPIHLFLLNAAICILAASILAVLYVRFGSSLSNRQSFARNLVFISFTTMLIITVVKSSLALSLGLVGALSIIRFRTAIKEPEELSALFIAIAIGLGFGANQTLLTLTGISIIFILFMISGHRLRKAFDATSNLEIWCDAKQELPLSKLNEVLGSHCRHVSLRHVQESHSGYDASYLIQFSGAESLDALKQALFGETSNLRIHFQDPGY